MNAIDNAIRIARAEGGKILLHTGAIHSSVPGRTDHLPVMVESGSYILPAHHVSGLGESNTQAGFKVIQHMFEGLRRSYSGTPYGGKGKIPYGGGEGPYGSELPRADGGKIPTGAPVACLLAGGECALSPDEVKMAGDGDLTAGHAALDDWVKRQTKKTVETIKKLPPPRKD